MSIRVDFHYDWLVWSPCCPGDVQEPYPAPQFKGINSFVPCLLYIPALTTVRDHWEDHSLTMWILVSRVMSLIFSTLSRFVLSSLPGSNCLLISWLPSRFTVILEPPKRKSVTASTFSPSICSEVVGLRPWSWFFKYLVLSQLVHSPPSPSKGPQFLFTFCHESRIICVSEVVAVSPASLPSSLHLIRPSISHEALSIWLNNRGTADSPVGALPQPWTSQFFPTGL